MEEAQKSGAEPGFSVGVPTLGGEHNILSKSSIKEASTFRENVGPFFGGGGLRLIKVNWYSEPRSPKTASSPITFDK